MVVVILRSYKRLKSLNWAGVKLAIMEYMDRSCVVSECRCNDKEMEELV